MIGKVTDNVPEVEKSMYDINLNFRSAIVFIMQIMFEC
jgi:hypothetical protein